MLIFWLLGCPSPDCDAHLRAGDLAAASAVYASQKGQPLSFAHPAADAMARRAPVDPATTCERIADTLTGVLLLDRTPLRGRFSVDMSFGSLATVLSQAFEMGATVVAVGRSENPGEREAVSGGALPWVDGRFIGSALNAADARALGATVDASPPPRLVTIGMSDGVTDVHIALQFKDGGWLAMSSLTPGLASRWLTFADSAERQGPEVARQRYGPGLGVEPTAASEGS